MTTADAITDADRRVHGETPTYDPRTGLLHWVDMTVGDLLTMDAGIGRPRSRRLHVGAVAACWRPRRSRRRGDRDAGRVRAHRPRRHRCIRCRRSPTRRCG